MNFIQKKIKLQAQRFTEVTGKTENQLKFWTLRNTRKSNYCRGTWGLDPMEP